MVLLHGLARRFQSMRKVQVALEKEGYRVLNVSYPSRRFRVEELSEIVLEKVAAETVEADQIHFVTHSLGGILVRYIQQNLAFDKIGRVVMLCPPNQGSEVVDRLGGFRAFEWVNGSAGLQLGTREDSVLKKLGAIDFELGVITGDRSINWILSTMLPGRNDGKVSVESARVSGMADFKVVHTTHPNIMNKREVIEDVIAFLRLGKFAGG